MQTLLQDVRYAVRMLAKNPGFTAVTVLTLALGIGANAAIFTVINAALLKKLPVGNPQELVILSAPDSHGMNMGSQRGDRDLYTYAEFQAIAAMNHVFTGVLAEQSGSLKLNVTAAGQNAQGAPAFVDLVSGSYFPVLGVSPVVGRAFGPEVDEKRDANPVAVISYGFWQSRFGGAASAVGSKIRIRSTSYDVIGVAPPCFLSTTVGFAPDMWVPLTMQTELYPGEDLLTVEKNPVEKTEWLQVIARRKPGVSVAQAKVDAELVFQQYLKSQIGTGITNADTKAFLDQHVPLKEGSRGGSVVHEEFGKPLLILMGVVGLVLLIACANVANLLLARARSRQKEIAVRISLGAGRGRLFRQLLTESLLLAGLGGAVGLLLAQWADALLLQMVSRSESPIPLDVHVDWKILGFTLGVSLLTGILFGVAPAFRAVRLDLNTILKGNARGVVGTAGGSGRIPLGKMLVVGQVAVSLVLLVVAALFVHSFTNLTRVPLGFDRDHLLLFDVSPLEAGYQVPAIEQLYKDLQARIAALPGVRGVSYSHNGLFSGSESGDEIKIDGYTPKAGQEMHVRFDHVGPNYFSTVGIPILAGREIGPQDEGSGQRVGVINQTMTKYYFGDENPIGRRIWDTFPTTYTDFIVVGVVGDAKYNQVNEKTPRRFYVPVLQPIETSEVRFARFEVRAEGNPSTIAASVREMVKQAAPALPPIEIETMNRLVSESLTSNRMITQLSEFFGLLAALLACIGLYGIMAYAVAGRVNEIGIRMALGAQGSSVLRMILRESLVLVVIGVAIGLPTVAGTSHLISSLLFGLTPADPIAIFAATLLMFFVAVTASYIPARRAARIDPMVALRYE